MRNLLTEVVFAAALFGMLGTVSAQACTLGSPVKPAAATAATTAVTRNAQLFANAENLPAHAPIVTGMWYSVFTDSLGDPPDPGFDSFYADGNELLIDQAAPATDNVCSGVWEQTGPLTYKVNHPSWFYALDGTFQGLVVIEETITLDRNGNKFTGTANVTYYDPNMVFQGQYSGSLTGVRVTANSKPL